MDLEGQLARRIRSTIGPDIRATMAIAIGDTPVITVSVCDSAIDLDPNRKADVTFTFDEAETALAVLTGTEDPFAAFLAGRFRSDGHLPLAFVLLGLFAPGADGSVPP